VHFNTPGTLFPHVKSGRLRALAITSAQRADFAPELPTVAESGVPGFEATVWYGVYGPKALPARLVQRWNDAINRYLQTPQAQAHWRRIDMITRIGAAKDFTDFLARNGALGPHNQSAVSASIKEPRMTSKKWKVVLAGECMSSRPFRGAKTRSSSRSSKRCAGGSHDGAPREMNFADRRDQVGVRATTGPGAS
jgi:hypothetical protein